MTIDVVVLSPHLDDAVLSLGGLIGREVAAGRKVEVVSCFTAGPPLDEISPDHRVFGDYTMRRSEDERALEILGASHRWLDLHERIWRQPPLPPSGMFPTHVFRTPKRMEDFAELRAIRAAIAELLASAATIYAPLAIGHHVDHVEVALAALREVLGRGAFDRIRFYEDPYGLGRACRSQHFVARRRMWRWFGAPAWASPHVGVLLRMVAHASKGPRIENYLPEADRLDWRCVPAPVAPVDEERKLAAIEQYGSQVRAFGGMARVRAFVRRGHAALGGEPIWSCRPASPR
ncbi:MAG: PIG-L family deacetylase [Kofleriaceae bacterium]|nr:PIG-L family deacetylase [Kofleriaceae bacterium]